MDERSLFVESLPGFWARDSQHSNNVDVWFAPTVMKLITTSIQLHGVGMEAMHAGLGGPARLGQKGMGLQLRPQPIYWPHGFDAATSGTRNQHGLRKYSKCHLCALILNFIKVLTFHLRSNFIACLYWLCIDVLIF
jgi:hypothetical protein